MPNPEPGSAVLQTILRDLAPQVLGVVVRKFRDFAGAEDAVQEALLAASQQWPAAGLPENPRAWLIQVANRRMTDFVRSESARRDREDTASALLFPSTAGASAGPEPEWEAQDDTLILLFLCCHPALTNASAIALTLRAVGGLTTAEIARAFLVPESTMAQRISRAKQSIQHSGVPFRMPESKERTERLQAVLHVLYLIFNEGYASSAGEEVARTELTGEAIRLTRALRQLLPRDSEVAGLLALMLLTDARRMARTAADGAMIPLSEQNRCLWDRSQIEEGVALVTKVLSAGEPGEYSVQAAIAAVHDESPSAEETDWPQILALYQLLRRMSANPVVALNHAVAVAMVRGPRAGLALLEELDSDAHLGKHHRLSAVRAHLLEMAGDHDGALEQYRIAAHRTGSVPERNYLLTRAAKLQQPRKVE